MALVVDHGPAGIASTIAQHHLKGKNPGWKAVYHKSRSLVSSARNYNKVEAESLAIYSGVLMNCQYLYGTLFTVMTDDSALPGLYSTRRPAPHMVERHKGRMGAFQFDGQHVPRDKNPCDYGSRHPDALPENLTRQEREDIEIETEEEDRKIWMNRVMEKLIPAITLEELVNATVTTRGQLRRLCRPHHATPADAIL